MRRPIALSLGLLGLGAVALCLAGPLDPPVGPVGSTYKTLTQVEPRIPIGSDTTPGDAQATFVISTSGSYYLTGNLTGQAQKYGIRVTVPGVTIDLMGFELSGVPGSYAGILAMTDAKGLHVRNGTIRGWGSDGVNAEATRGCVFDALRLMHCQSGIRLGRAATITDSTVTANTSYGITGDMSVVRGCTASANGSNGISLSDGGVIESCTATNNGGDGIAALFRATIISCTASSNANDGIFAQSGCTVKQCTSASNTENGIRVHSGCLVVGNTCYQNGSGAGDGAGILGIGNSTRIEDNTVTDNDRGIDVDYANNFIVRNTARANTGGNFSVVAGNEFAPVITNPGTTFTNATPWSNFAY